MANPKREAKKQRANQARAIREAAARRRKRNRVIIPLACVALLAVSLGLALDATTNDADLASDESPTTTAAPAADPNFVCPPATGAERKVDFAGPPTMCIDPAKTYTAAFDTTEGRIVVKLDTQKTPNTANNFVVLARHQYYDNTSIFRVDPSIDIIQGGSPHTQDNTDPGPGYTIPDEGSGFTYAEGDLVMARTGAPNSGGGQYFFATGPDVAGLNGQGTYVKFGTAIEGLDVLKTLGTLHEPSGDKPTKTITVNKITINES